LEAGDNASALVPEGTSGETQRLRVMKEVWDEYLNAGEISAYVKFAVAMTALGSCANVAWENPSVEQTIRAIAANR